jgi:hypothetical protein
MSKANEELVEINRRSEPSVLQKRSYEVMNELSTRCPVVSDILSKLLDIMYLPEKKIPAACLIYGIIMFMRCHELSRIQRINTILLTQGHTSTNVSSNCLFMLILYNCLA